MEVCEHWWWFGFFSPLYFLTLATVVGVLCPPAPASSRTVTFRSAVLQVPWRGTRTSCLLGAGTG